MKRSLLLLTTLVALTTVAAQSRTETFTLPSTILGCERPCTVYLPDGYDSSEASYPVLYLLHGAGGCHTNWVELGNMQQITDEAIDEGRIRPMIVVMPDASDDGRSDARWRVGYFDLPGWEYARFFIEELLPAVERHYRIRADKQHRAIAGLSMGGCGTLYYAQHHPELFGSACPLSALIQLDASRPAANPDYIAAFEKHNALAFLRTMSNDQAAALRTVRWWVDCGDDDFLWEGNILFYAEMRRHGIPLQYRMRDGGHTWRYWRTALPDVLTFVSVGFGQ